MLHMLLMRCIQLYELDSCLAMVSQNCYHKIKVALPYRNLLVTSSELHCGSFEWQIAHDHLKLSLNHVVSALTTFFGSVGIADLQPAQCHDWSVTLNLFLCNQLDPAISARFSVRDTCESRFNDRSPDLAWASFKSIWFTRVFVYSNELRKV